MVTKPAYNEDRIPFVIGDGTRARMHSPVEARVRSRRL
jgi:hypothetical protein